MAISKEEILTEIRKYVAHHAGNVPGERTFKQATGIKEFAWKGRHWIRWTDAVREAGFAPNKFERKIPDEEILQKLAVFVKGLGRFPVRDEINLRARTDPGFPFYQILLRRYGGMAQTAAALLDYARKTKNEHVAELCKARLEQEKPEGAPYVVGKKPDSVGFVYLKYAPSLRLYKIGKANNSSKRGAGISLLLPEDLVPKHEIKTDYPYILEKYWEYRFRLKKKQGEWYDLNSEDVEAFKRRREFIFGEFFP